MHGGSLRVTLAHAPGTPAPSVSRLLAEEAALGVTGYDYYRDFGDRVQLLKEAVVTKLATLKGEGRRLAAYGAAAKATVLLNYFGIGAKLIRKVMKDNGVSSLEDLITVAKELDVRLVACDMSQELLGISDNELMDGLHHGDVATFLADSSRAKATIFI